MDMDIAMTHFTLLELVIAVLAGIQAGFFYAWAQHLGTHFFHSFVLSANFFTAIIVSTALLDRPRWEGWLGVWLLWVMFQLGVTSGYKLRVWYVRRSRKAH